MKNYTKHFFAFILTLASLAMTSDLAHAYTQTTANCINMCGPGAGAYPIVGFPATGIDFDVDTNASSYNGTSCSVGVPSAIGTSVKCAVAAMNHILAWDIGLTFDQPTSEDFSNNGSEIFQQTATWMAGKCADPTAPCFAINRTAYTCNCTQQQANYAETDIAINDLLYTGFHQNNQLTPPRYHMYYGWPSYGQVSMRQAILHELGHSYLLGHIEASDTMWGHYPTGGGWPEQGSGSSNGYFMPLSDMSKGIRALHGTVGGTDIGVGAHWLNFDQEVAQVAPTHLTRCPGDTWVQRYILHNPGSNSTYAHMSFYLSTNDQISSGDIYVGMTGSAYRPAGDFFTSTITLTVPNSVSYGQTYHIGGLVNKTGDINDHNDSIAFSHYAAMEILDYESCH